MSNVTAFPSPFMDDGQEYSEGAFIQMMADRYCEKVKGLSGTEALGLANATLETVRGDGQPLTRSYAHEVVDSDLSYWAQS